MKLSILIANFNRAEFISRAIRSCIHQIVFRKPYEIIVIDDCSTDNSVDVISEFQNEIRFIKNHSNLGIAKTSNIGLDISDAEYWMRVDSDDFISEFAVSFMINILESNADIDFVYTDHLRIDIDGNTIDHIRLDTNEKLYEHGAGIMFRKKILDEINGYDESLHNAEDYDLLIRLIKNGKRGFYLPVPLYRYYMHDDNLTKRFDRKYFVNKVKDKYEI